ncbi:endonuclease/exonuclease/phosphatase family protein [Shimia sp. R9_2]|uniref:endonuclease/exonuclease/phosphatase family protein n=1 Tax=Shimia sp. R9_2 TaxID=2821112 RepID=UPI001AD97FE6|nr:endonuclease/exonuclease/phosphatase family protein [Shimia sp. R9_2]MBO9399163.1 endonuclease/exonuclease/phosphatase family protein [Shimia sp. R9_2]
MSVKKIFGGMLAALCVATIAVAQDIRIVSYNVESDSDTNVNLVARDIKEIGSADIWGLQEVDGFDAIFKLREAMDAPDREMWFELGLSGKSDRLAIVYDRMRFKAVEGPEEITDVGGSRPPLRMKLVDIETGVAFNVIVNHFNRGNSSLRREQAKRLRDWIKQTDEPTIALGDFNFDLEVEDWKLGQLNGNRAFHIFTSTPSPVLWAQHEPQLTTQCSHQYNSVLDFIFLGGSARLWDAEVTLFFADDVDYCPDEKKGGADHYPLIATLSPTEVSGLDSSNADLLKEISRIQEQLNLLQQRVQSR